jgi:transcriptional regulator with XRE-family HTH domain
VHTTEWDRDLLRTTLQEIMNQADLTQAAVGELAGRDRTMANRWLSGRHQPTYEAASRFTAALRARRPDLGDLLDRFMRAAGYETHTQPASQPAQRTLDALREKARTDKQSLGELLIREGLADPEELVIPDVLPPDKMMEEIMSLDIPDEKKANLLRLHLENRAYRAEEERLRGKKPDGA